MSARQLNRLAKAKGLDPLLGGSLNVDSDESDAPEDSDEDGGQFASGMVVSASVSTTALEALCGVVGLFVCAFLGYQPFRCVFKGTHVYRVSGAVASACAGGCTHGDWCYGWKQPRRCSCLSGEDEHVEADARPQGVRGGETERYNSWLHCLTPTGVLPK